MVHAWPSSWFQFQNAVLRCATPQESLRIAISGISYWAILREYWWNSRYFFAIHSTLNSTRHSLLLRSECHSYVTGLQQAQGIHASLVHTQGILSEWKINPINRQVNQKLISFLDKGNPRTEYFHTNRSCLNTCLQRGFRQMPLLWRTSR